MHRAVFLGLILSCLAAAPSKDGKPAAAPAPPPALELKRVLNFLLEGSNLPDNSGDLASIIASGLKKRITLPTYATPVIAVGGEYPHLQSLTIDFSNSVIQSDQTVPRLRPLGAFEQVIRAREFQVIADPMNVDGGAMTLKLTAKDVALGVQRDRRKQPILVFNGAREGEVHLHTTADDIARMLHASANYRGKKYGLSVQRSVLRLSSENERHLNADLRLHSMLVLLPVQLHLTARVDVDDDGMAKISNLTCDGSDLAGWLISGMIRPALAKYDGKTIALVTFPSSRIKLRDVRIKVDGDRLHVGAGFGVEPRIAAAK